MVLATGIAGVAAAGARLPRTSPPAPHSTSSAAPRLPQRNLTLAARSSVRNRSALISFSVLIHKVNYKGIKIKYVTTATVSVPEILMYVSLFISRIVLSGSSPWELFRSLCDIWELVAIT